MIQRFDVLIVGGGMVGASLAAMLSEQGRTVGVVEANAAPKPFDQNRPYEARVIAVSRATQRLFQKLDVWHEVLGCRALPYQRMEVWDANGVGEISFDAKEAGEPDLGAIVENALLERKLYEACQAKSNLNWIDQASIERIVVDEKEVIVTLADGRMLMANLLVGADGVNSYVRKEMGFKINETAYSQKAIVALVKMESHHQNTAWQRFSEDAVLALLPMPDGWISIVWSARDEKADQLMALDDEEFGNALSVASSGCLGKVVDLGQRLSFPLSGVQAEPYVKPRVALIGDAAHRVHPLAGQGANLGFLDVMALAKILSETDRDPGGMSVLRRYQRARAGENLLMQRTMEGFQHLFMNKFPPLVMLRSAGLNITNQIDPLKYGMMRYAFGVHPGGARAD